MFAIEFSSYSEIFPLSQLYVVANELENGASDFIWGGKIINSYRRIFYDLQFLMKNYICRMLHITQISRYCAQ